MSVNFDQDQLRVKALELAISYLQGRSGGRKDVVEIATEFLEFLKYEELV